MVYEDGKIIVFLDTGASGSLMSEETYLKGFSHISLEKFKVIMCDVQSNGIEVVGKMKLRLIAKGLSVFDEVLITRGIKLGDWFLIGHPAMLNNRIFFCLT